MHNYVSRRTALGLLVGSAGAGLLAACGPTPAATTAPPTSAPATSRSSGRAYYCSHVGAGGCRCDQRPIPSHRPPTVASAPSPATPAPGAPTPQPKSGGTLHYGLASPLTSIWPTFAGTEGTQDIYDRLLTYDTNLQPVPALVESWELAARLQADQAQPAQGRDVPYRPRPHKQKTSNGTSLRIAQGSEA